MNKDIKNIVKALGDNRQNPGWRVERRTKHLVAYPADKAQPPITIPLTPSDHRSLRNLRAQLRRAGARGV